MTSKQDAKPPFSPVLFLEASGEPMRFYLRPGPTKVQLQPLIRAGGGGVCRTAEPNAILLADPEDMAAVPNSAAHLYVSTQYIRDCVERNQQLELEDYRFAPKKTAQVMPRRQRQRGSGVGRLPYTSEEDAAILDFISQHKSEAGGNRVWQQMECQRLTGHSWQSMKDRYRRHLSGSQSEEGRGRQPKRPRSRVPEALPEKSDIPEPTPKKSNVPEPLSEKSAVLEPSPMVPDVPPLSPNKELPPQTSSDPPPPLASSSPEREEPPLEPEREEPPLEPEREQQQMEPEESASTQSPKIAKLLSAATVSETNKATTSSAEENSKEAGRKKTSARKLGHLAALAREFDTSSSEPDDDETPDLQGGAASPGPGSRDQAPAVPSDLQGEGPEPQGEGEGPEPVSPVMEEYKQRMRRLMEESGQGLVEITKALLTTSGSVSDALRYLKASPLARRRMGPFWMRCHDDRLLSGDTSELCKIFGEERVAKRMAFLDDWSQSSVLE